MFVQLHMASLQFSGVIYVLMKEMTDVNCLDKGLKEMIKSAEVILSNVQGSRMS